MNHVCLIAAATFQLNSIKPYISY